MSVFKTIDLFAGIGGIRLGFEAFGCQNVFTSEWDKDAQTMYEVNFGERPAGDITKILPEFIPDHDILLAGFPCQPFSIIGSGKGFADTRGTLFFNIEEILRVKQPRAFLLENVKQLKTHDSGRTFKTIVERLEGLGYFVHATVLNALDFGLPQKRERTFIVGFRENLAFKFPPKQGLPEDFKIVGSYTALRKLTGNSVAVPVIRAVAGQMIKALENRQIRNAQRAHQLSLLEI